MTQEHLKDIDMGEEPVKTMSMNPKKFMLWLAIASITMMFAGWTSGYLVRKAIYEILPITKELTEHIKNNSTSIETYIDQNKIETLKSNAIKMITNGETSVEEVFSLLMI